MQIIFIYLSQEINFYDSDSVGYPVTLIMMNELKQKSYYIFICVI